MESRANTVSVSSMKCWRHLSWCTSSKKEPYMFVCCFLGALLLLLLLTITGTSDDLWKRNDLFGTAADSPTLIRHLKEQVILPPSTLPYNLFYGPEHDPSDGQSVIIDHVLGGLHNGFYVESGGYTGEVMSNTLFFETKRGWQGILIEPDDTNYAKIRSRNRKSYTAHACLAETEQPKKTIFQMHKYAGHIVRGDNEVDNLLLSTDDFHVSKCYPLYSFLLALGQTTVDYLSLDVESSEYKVLATVPWDKVDIKTMSVEYNLIPEGKEALIHLMTSFGYIHYMEFNKQLTHDLIFVKPELLTPELVRNNNLPILREDNTIKYVNLDSR